MKKKQINVLLVDDRDLIRDLLKLMFSRDEYITVTGEAEDGLKALELAKHNKYDVVIMDINMPNLNGLETTKRLKKEIPNLKILANSFHQNDEYIQAIIRAGASGYITKDESLDEYKEAIWTVFNEGIYLSDKIDGRIYEKVLKKLKYPVL